MRRASFSLTRISGVKSRRRTSSPTRDSAVPRDSQPSRRRTQPRSPGRALYLVRIGNLPIFRVPEADANHLCRLIEKSAGIDRISARRLLDGGKLLVTQDLIVCRADLLGCARCTR